MEDNTFRLCQECVLDPSHPCGACRHNRAVIERLTALVEGKKPKNASKKSPRFKPPTLEEVGRYCAERDNLVDAQKFVDHYTSNGWRVGKNPMKDWRAAVRTWERSETVRPSVPAKRELPKAADLLKRFEAP